MGMWGVGGEVTSPTIIVQLHADHKVFNVAMWPFLSCVLVRRENS